MSTIFNKKDTSVIAFALNNTLEVFVEEYKETSATSETLKKAFDEINKNKTKSNIAVKSGQGSPEAPLEAIGAAYALDTDGEIKKVDTTNIPVRTDLNDASFAEDGTVIAETVKPVKKTKNTTTLVVKDKVKTAPVAGQPTKRDAIREILKHTPAATNREIKDKILASGFTSCYDSEINGCKVK